MRPKPSGSRRSAHPYSTSRRLRVRSCCGCSPPRRRSRMGLEPRILLADDDDIGRYVVATMLRRAGFVVSEVADGLDAVRAVTAQQPDIAVLDVKMPGLDGFEACRRLKSDEATRHIPVLMLSA